MCMFEAKQWTKSMFDCFRLSKWCIPVNYIDTSVLLENISISVISIMIISICILINFNIIITTCIIITIIIINVVKWYCCYCLIFNSLTWMCMFEAKQWTKSMFDCFRLSKWCIPVNYIDTSVLLENIRLVKFIKTTSRTRVAYFP